MADLEGFLPTSEHPLYLSVLRELVRVDLEYGWQRHQPRSLEDYRRRFPALFADPASLEAVAFEEYRLRQQAGELPYPGEYRERFGVHTDDWPVSPDTEGADADLEITRVVSSDGPSGSDLAYQAYLQAKAAAAVTQPTAEEARERSVRPRVGSKFLGFLLEEELGRGAFGHVYLAKQGELADRYVALKVSADLPGESQTLAQLQHTNIVPIYSVHRAPPFHAVCMPFLGRTTLADVLKELRVRDALPGSGKELVSTLDACKSVTRRPGSSRPAPRRRARRRNPPPEFGRRCCPWRLRMSRSSCASSKD